MKTTNKVVANALEHAVAKSADVKNDISFKEAELKMDKSKYPTLLQYGYLLPGNGNGGIQKTLTDVGTLSEKGKRENLIKFGEKMAREREKYLCKFQGPVGVPRFDDIKDIPYDKLKDVCIEYAVKGLYSTPRVDGRAFSFTSKAFEERKKIPSDFPMEKVEKEYHKWCDEVQKLRKRATNAAFKVGDRIRLKSKPRDPNSALSWTPSSVYQIMRIDSDWLRLWEVAKDGHLVRSMYYINENEDNAVKNAAPMSAHEASVLLSGKRKAVTQYMKVEPNTLYYRALGGIFAVPESDTMRTAIKAIGSRVLPYKVGGVVGNSMSAEVGKNRIYKTTAGTFVLIGKSGAPMGEYATKELAEKTAKTMGWGDVPVVNSNAVAINADYSKTLKDITDSVKPYMDKRIKGDTSWKYPMLVITVLRKVCDSAVMSAGRYDGQRPPHRVYDITCTKDGFKFQGNLVVTGLVYKKDRDDVSAFDEYDMTLSLMNVGKATNAVVNAEKDKWIDNFHVIITDKTPDSALVTALKEKAAAWKVAKRNFGNNEAQIKHTQLEDKAMEIAKRLGAKWIQQGAVTKVVMPGCDPFFNSKAVAKNYTFKVGDRVKADKPYGVPGEIGVIKAIGFDGDLTVDFSKRGTVRVPCAYAIGLNKDA